MNETATVEYDKASLFKVEGDFFSKLNIMELRGETLAFQTGMSSEGQGGYYVDYSQRERMELDQLGREFLKLLDLYNLSTDIDIELRSLINPPDCQVNLYLNERQLVQEFRALRQLLNIYFFGSVIEFKLLSGNDDEDDTIIDVRIFDDNTLDAFLKNMHLLMAQLIRLDGQRLYRIISLTHWRRNINGLHGFYGNRTVS